MPSKMRTRGRATKRSRRGGMPMETAVRYGEEYFDARGQAGGVLVEEYVDARGQAGGVLGGMRRGSVKNANRSRRSAKRSRRAKSIYRMTV